MAVAGSQWSQHRLPRPSLKENSLPFLTLNERNDFLRRGIESEVGDWGFENPKLFVELVFLRGAEFNPKSGKWRMQECADRRPRSLPVCAGIESAPQNRHGSSIAWNPLERKAPAHRRGGMDSRAFLCGFTYAGSRQRAAARRSNLQRVDGVEGRAGRETGDGPHATAFPRRPEGVGPIFQRGYPRVCGGAPGDGKFTRVSVEVNPEAEGLRVTFILEPAFYIGMIDFPGGTKVFSFQRLLQVVNYPPQEPYQSDRVAQGEKELKRFLAREGYFTAQVKAETRLDQPRQVADLVYNVTLGPRARIGKIEIIGPDEAEVKELKGALRSIRARLHGANLKEGKPYDSDHLQAATRFLQDFLGKQNHLAARVRMSQPTYDPASNRAGLRWRVTLGPEVLISVEGAKISGRTLRTLVPIYEENSFDQDLVQEGKQKLISYFQGKGYFDEMTPT